MFKNWGFLLGEIWILILLAALLGLFVGWLIWGRRAKVVVEDAGDLNQLRTDLEECRGSCKEKDDLIGRLEARLEGRGVGTADLDTKPAAAAAPAKRVDSAPSKVESASDENPDFDRDGVKEGADEGVKPMTLDAPRAGKGDNLKMIKGVGPKLEQLCNRLGFWHFDQIANWTDDEVAWVNANLEGFKGRVTRDNWVEQAKLLSEGGQTEFSERVEAGEVYEKDKS